MEVSFDGLRSEIFQRMLALREALEECLSDLRKDDAANLKEKYDEAAAGVNVLNCLYDDEVEGDCSDMSHTRIDLFNDEDED